MPEVHQKRTFDTHEDWSFRVSELSDSFSERILFLSFRGRQSSDLAMNAVARKPEDSLIFADRQVSLSVANSLPKFVKLGLSGS